jgi:hypothetical protein
MRDLLFSELINFMDKIILEKIQNYYLSHEKYSESSKNSRKILRDIMEYEEPK